MVYDDLFETTTGYKHINMKEILNNIWRKHYKRMEEKNMMKCKRCGYIWRERVNNPKECPNCKRRL